MVEIVLCNVRFLNCKYILVYKCDSLLYSCFYNILFFSKLLNHRSAVVAEQHKLTSSTKRRAPVAPDPSGTNVLLHSIDSKGQFTRVFILLFWLLTHDNHLVAAGPCEFLATPKTIVGSELVYCKTGDVVKSNVAIWNQKIYIISLMCHQNEVKFCVG